MPTPAKRSTPTAISPCSKPGGHFLEYNVLLENPVDGQHLGIVLIELGVGITVAATLIIIFYCFAGRDS